MTTIHNWQTIRELAREEIRDGLKFEAVGPSLGYRRSGKIVENDKTFKACMRLVRDHVRPCV